MPCLNRFSDSGNGSLEARITANPTTQWDRNLSPLKVSPKREFLGFGLETFGRFSPKLPLFGNRRPGGIARKARKLQDFRALSSRYLWLSEWMAGAGGIEPPNGGIKTCLII